MACQAPLSMGFPRQEYWSVLPFPSPGDIHDPGIKPMSPALAGRFFIAEPLREVLYHILHITMSYIIVNFLTKWESWYI